MIEFRPWIKWLYQFHYSPFWKWNHRLRILHWLRLVAVVWLLFWIVNMVPWVLVPFEAREEGAAIDREQTALITALSNKLDTFREVQLRVVEQLLNTTKKIDDHLYNTGGQETRLVLVEKQLNVLIGLGAAGCMLFATQIVAWLVQIRVKREVLKEISELQLIRKHRINEDIEEVRHHPHHLKDPME